jgi:flagellar export protein FliJ
MREFRFRAAAALELRRQQESAAGVTLAQAEARFREAEAVLEAGIAKRQAAQAAQNDTASRGTDIATLEWHRNWITRLAATITRLRHEVDVRAAVVRDAENAWRDARRRRLALERMKDRAWRRFHEEQRRQELKVIDELARLRFTVPGLVDERTRHDD